MALYFITGNKNKFKEVKSILPSVKQLNIDLLEIQSINAIGNEGLFRLAKKLGNLEAKAKTIL